MSPNIMEKLLQSISSNDYYIGIAAIIKPYNKLLDKLDELEIQYIECVAD